MNGKPKDSPDVQWRVIRSQNITAVIIAIIGALTSIVIAWLGARSAAKSAVEEQRPQIQQLKNAANEVETAIQSARRFADPVLTELDREGIASADGIVTAWITAHRTPQTLVIYGVAGPASKEPYTRAIAHIRVLAGETESASVTFPVLKGEKWKVEVVLAQGTKTLKDNKIYFFPMVQ